ncbi:murein hydrolase activator EnvC family protein [Thermocrinis jamiesonii]|uniref:murein hydrolase activator EnvC family protein n=1 Tax=Thermocrinis jamiesonii TaxID=1302351 RepID=UPI000689BD5A|nr:M23 family metallopeptidase [Thermocrinis jamiesonii]
MVPMVFLLFIFISSCVQIEIRDKKPTAPKYTPKPQEAVKPKEQPVVVPMPVKGTPTKSERGYFIKTACGEFFRALENGKVLYAGDDLKSHGLVVMVEQENGYIAVYTKAGNLFVKKGEMVKKAQVLGRVGRDRENCGIGFELRLQDGSPINFEFSR